VHYFQATSTARKSYKNPFLKKIFTNRFFPPKLLSTMCTLHFYNVTYSFIYKDPILQLRNLQLQRRVVICKLERFCKKIYLFSKRTRLLVAIVGLALEQRQHVSPSNRRQNIFIKMVKLAYQSQSQFTRKVVHTYVCTW
jgi:hypothetical protein